MLETLGHLRVEDRCGLFVADPDAMPAASHRRFPDGYSLREIYQFRLMLELATLTLALPRIAAEDMGELKHLTETMLTGARQGQPVRAAECDTLFHGLIFLRCPNRIYQDVRKQLSREMQESQWMPMTLPDWVKETAQEHFRIVEALEADRREEACTLLESHIRAAAVRANVEM